MSGRTSSVPEDAFGPEDVRLGHITGVFGLRGEVRVYLHNPDTELFDAPRPVVFVSATGARQQLRMGLRPGAGRRILGRIEGVNDVAAAERFVGCELVVTPAALPPLPDGEWYHAQLLGCAVETDAGRALGTLRSILDNGAFDTWEVDGPSGRWWVHARLDDIVLVEPGARIVVRDAAPMQL